jgi:hypothetical protein
MPVLCLRPIAPKLETTMSRARTGLLTTETKRDFVRRRKKLTEEIKPTSEVEHEYVDDFAHSSWEIQRYRGIEA